MASVGPATLSVSSVPDGHRGQSWEVQSPTHARSSMLPKKERLRLGRERDKARLTALRAQLAAATGTRPPEQVSSDSSDHDQAEPGLDGTMHLQDTGGDSESY